MRRISSVIPAFIAILLSGSSFGQTPPVITGPGPGGSHTATSAAFWYLGGILPSCCSDTPNQFYTEWPVYLTLNTNAPNPTITWGTDSPTRVTIQPSGTTGATLVATGHSAQGNTFDIHIWVTVNGLQSALFPVFINTPWTTVDAAPIQVGSCSTFPAYPNGYWGGTQVSVKDLTSTYLIPIDVAESHEHEVPVYTGENWGLSSNGTWDVSSWKTNSGGNYYFLDSYLACWGPPQNPIPQTVSWGTQGAGAKGIDTETQKYFFGTLTPFRGECPERKAVEWYTDHVGYNAETSPITNPTLCQQGQYAN